MLRHPSAQKRARQALKRRARARIVKGKMKSAIDRVMELLESSKVEEARKAARLAESAIAKAVSKGVIKKEKGSRMISRLMAKVNRAPSSNVQTSPAPQTVSETVNPA